MFAADMEYILVGTAAIAGMAVDTHAQAAAVLNESSLFEIGKVALVDAHVLMLLVVGCYAAVGDAACTNGVVADIDEERTIARPTAITVSSHRHAEVRASVLTEQLVPLVGRKIGIVPSNMNATAEASVHGDIDSADAIISHCEVQWCHIHRHGHSDIVRKYVRLAAYLSLIGWLHVTSNE